MRFLWLIVACSVNRSILFKAEKSLSLTSCWFSINRLNNSHRCREVNQSDKPLISKNNINDFISDSYVYKYDDSPHITDFNEIGTSSFP